MTALEGAVGATTKPAPANASRRWLRLLPCVVLLLGTACTVAQEAVPKQDATGATSSTSQANQNTPELSTHEETATFKVNVRLVLVRVVVRDQQRHAVGNLTKNDFQLFDNGKPQIISHFSIEKPGAQVAEEQKSSRTIAEEKPAQGTPELAERYVAYLFDDVHLNIADLMQVRKAAEQHLESLQPTDRAAIFTTSGQNNIDFTDNHGRLRDALLRLQTRGMGTVTNQCPYMTYYMADLIQNQHDDRALQAATMDALSCAFGNDSRQINAARAHAEAAALQELTLGDSETRLAIDTLKNAVRALSIMPGQRAVVLVSPGFLTSDYHYDVGDIIDQAVRANTLISSVDARGLYVLDFAAASGSANAFVAGVRSQFEIDAASVDSDVLGELADGTGGTFFHNNNDLVEGFRRTAAAPEYYYVLGFSPQNLKLDGRFHALKVTVKKPGLTLQARKGYYAPKHLADSSEQAKQEIEEAVFSREEIHNLPVQLRTQFFKASDDDAKVAVLVHVRVKQLRYEKAEGRNRNDLTIVSALFDRNGRFVTGNQKTLQMRWKDETLANHLGSGITLKSSFDVKPGSYLVRLVVRDAQGQLSAESGAIQIP